MNFFTARIKMKILFSKKIDIHLSQRLLNSNTYLMSIKSKSNGWKPCYLLIFVFFFGIFGILNFILGHPVYMKTSILLKLIFLLRWTKHIVSHFYYIDDVYVLISLWNSSDLMMVPQYCSFGSAGMPAVPATIFMSVTKGKVKKK